MEPPAGPPRFECPADFSASLFCPRFSREALQEPSKELWLIRAPANFSPESLDGHSVPLQGFQPLKASQPGGAEKIFHVQTALEHLGGARLLLPSDHRDHLACSPPFGGSLSIFERYGDPGGNQPLFTVAARPPPQIPVGLKQRFLPFGSNPGRALLPGALEEPPRKKRKKQKKKQRLGEEGSGDQVPFFGAGEREAGGQGEVGGAGPLAVDFQPGSVTGPQGKVLSGEPEDMAALSKKKKKRKEDKLKEGMGAEAESGRQHENGAAPLPNDSQTSSAADARNSLLSGEAEEPGPRSKKKKKRKEGGGLEGETGREAEATRPHREEGAVLWGIDSVAQDGLLSGRAEDPGPKSKKKKKRKESREVEAAGIQAEATHLHQENGTTPWVTSPRPSSRLLAQDCLLSSETEDPASIRRRKKKKKRKEEMGIEAEGLLDLGGGSEPQAGEDSLPGREQVTQGIHEERTGQEKAVSPELFSSQEDDAGGLWDFSGPGPTPEGGLVLAGEDPGAGSSSHKAKKKKRKKEAGRELEGWPAQQGEGSLTEPGTPLVGGGGQEAESGREELSQKRKKKRHHRRLAGLEEVGSS